MTQLQLPPRGVLVSPRMIYYPQLPPSVILTWIQLRGLAWGGTVTPPLCMQELAEVTGKSQATIYNHLVLLRQIQRLYWRSAGDGRIVVFFGKAPSKIKEVGDPPQQDQNSEILDSEILESEILESENPTSSPLNNINQLITPLDQEELISLDLKEGSKENDHRNEELKREEADSKFQESGIDSRNLESATPLDIYRAIVHLTPTVAQKRILQARVTNLPLWQQTLEHWIMHNWNPRNIAGMLDLYGRGGASACHFCSRRQESSQLEKSALPSSHLALDELRRELGIPSANDQP